MQGTLSKKQVCEAQWTLKQWLGLPTTAKQSESGWKAKAWDGEDLIYTIESEAELIELQQRLSREALEDDMVLVFEE